jgi:hypothetical protein
LEFLDVLVQTDALEALPQAAAERSGGAFLSPHGIAENVAHLFLHAVAVAICLTPESSLDVFFEVSDDELSHEILPELISRYQYLGRRFNRETAPHFLDISLLVCKMPYRDSCFVILAIMRPSPMATKAVMAGPQKRAEVWCE